MAKSAFDYTGIPGLFHDIATAGSNNDPWYVDGINFAKDAGKIATTPLRGAIKGLFYVGQKSYDMGGVVRENLEEEILAAPFMYNKFKNTNENYDAYRTRVAANKDKISIGQATLSILSPGKNAGKSPFFDEWTENNFKFLSGGFDIFNEEDRKIAFENQYTGKFLSGMNDLTASTFIDPLTVAGFVGKGAVIFSKATMLDNVTGILPNAPFARKVFNKVAMTPERMDNVLERALQGEGAAVREIDELAATDRLQQAKYWQKKKVTHPDAMAFLFGEAKTREQVIQTFRAVMLNDQQAAVALTERNIQNASEIKVVLDNLSEVPLPTRHMLEGKLDGDLLVSPEYNGAIKDFVATLAKEDPRYMEALNLVSTGTELKSGFSRVGTGRMLEKSKKFADEMFAEPSVITIQKTSLHPTIQVVVRGAANLKNKFTQEVPSGSFDLNQGNSYVEFNAFLKEAIKLSGGTFAPKAKVYADMYLSEVTGSGRMNVIAQAERDSLTNLFPNYTQKELDKLYAIYDSRRSNAIKQHKDQGFVSFMSDNGIVHATDPVLNTEGANRFIIADLRKLKYAVDAHEGTLPGILNTIDLEDLALRGEKSKAALATINDIFKTSVLLRFGYTVRNQAEAQLSMLAKGFALPAIVAANGPEAVKRFFMNRKIGADRMIDSVMVQSGRRDDFGALQNQISTHMDNLLTRRQTIDQFAQEIAKRKQDLITDNFKLRTTTTDVNGVRIGTGPLEHADEIRILHGALLDSKSQAAYHGTSDRAFKLSNTKPIALTTSRTVAQGYSQSGTVHSVENYLRTPSGVPGRIGEKPTPRAANPIGSDEFNKSITLNEFQRLDDYVRMNQSSATSIKMRRKFDRVIGIENNYSEVIGLSPTKPLSQDEKKFINTLKSIINKSVITQPTTVYRKTLNPDVPNLEVGDIYTEKYFTSTSKAKDSLPGSLRNNHILNIKLPSGIKALDVNSLYNSVSENTFPNYSYGNKIGKNEFAQEDEILLAPGMQFKVLAISDIPGTKLKEVSLEAILPNREPALPKALSIELAERAMKGGFSVSAVTFNHASQGFMVSRVGGGKTVFSKNIEETSAFIDEFIGNYVYSDFDTNTYFGAWRNPATGELVFDIVDNVADKDIAIALGTRRDQYAIRDILAKEDINTGGTGGELAEKGTDVSPDELYGQGTVLRPNTKELYENDSITKKGMVLGFSRSDASRTRRLRAKTERLNTAVDELKSDMIDAVNSGKKVEIFNDKTGNWRRVKALTWNNIRIAEEDGIVFNPEDYHRAKFRVDGSQGSQVKVDLYGESLDLRSSVSSPASRAVIREVFKGRAKDFKSWQKSKGWKDENDPIFKWMRDNGYGQLKVTEGSRLSDTIVALPEAIGAKGRKREIDSYISKLEESVNLGAPLPVREELATTGERRAARKNQIRRERLRKKEVAVNPREAVDNANSMINNGVEDAVRQLMHEYAVDSEHIDNLTARLGARITTSEKNSIKHRVGYGTTEIEHNGNKYNIDNIFENASYVMNNTSAERTYSSQLNGSQIAFSTGQGSRVVTKLTPSDPRYFEGWANILNMHFRDPETGVADPIVRRILDGESDEEIMGFFRTQDGMLYANNTYTKVGDAYGFTKLKGGELDEELAKKIAITRNSVKLYIPDDETAAVFSSGKENGKPLSAGQMQQFLVERFAKQPEKLNELNGLLVVQSKEFKDQERLIDGINRRVMRFLGSLPEDVFARHPLANMIYDRQVRLNIAALADAKGVERLSADEVNRAVTAAREEARREVERTLFTIIRRTGASNSQFMQLMFPFYGAFENTIKRWSGIIGENPAVLANASRTLAQVVNGQLVVDKDGNQITDATKLEGQGNLIVKVPQGFIDALPGEWRSVVENAFKNVSIPLSSLDVITQGNPGNPGFGPYAVLPTYLILRNRPELEDAFRPLFPAGMPNNSLDIFAPSVLRRLKTMWSKDEQYVRTFNQQLRYETYNYNTGKRTDIPTIAEITSKTNKFYLLRAISSVTLPFAVGPEMDFYQMQFRQFQAQYTAPGEAESKFLEMYPDFAEATVSLSKNPGGLEANIDTVKNLRKHQELMGMAESKGQQELMGFLANDFDGQYTFSQAAYQWQYRQGAFPGSTTTYRQNRNPADLIKDANLKQGWNDYGKIADYIDAFKIQNGITSNNDSALKPMQEAKSMWVDSMIKSNPDWYAEYISPDRGKYIQRASVLEAAVSDKKWMAQNGQRAVVKALVVYLDVRKQISLILQQRNESGGSSSMIAKSNMDIAEAFDKIKTQLSVESPEFGQFVNRYFTNDTVVG